VCEAWVRIEKGPAEVYDSHVNSNLPWTWTRGEKKSSVHGQEETWSSKLLFTPREGRRSKKLFDDGPHDRTLNTFLCR